MNIINSHRFGEVEPVISNYVFNGDTDAYFLDEAVTPSMLDNVDDPQTWVVRMKIDMTAAINSGIIGTSDGLITSLRWEIDGVDPSNFDMALDDNALSTMINVIWGPDTGWNTYFFNYDSTNGLEVFKGVTSLKSNASLAFTTRTAGRTLTVGATDKITRWFRGEISDVQLYDRILNATERSNLVTNITNTAATNLVLHFAEKKGPTLWTSNVNSNNVLTNQGGVTTN